jgi:hypothetical protein
MAMILSPVMNTRRIAIRLARLKMPFLDESLERAQTDSERFCCFLPRINCARLNL